MDVDERVEGAEGDTEGFTEASVVVVVDFSGVHDDADAELSVLASGGCETGAVAGQQPAKRGDGAVQHDRLGGLVDRMDQGKKAVATVGEAVTVTPVDACRAQRLIEQIVEGAAEFGFDGVRTAMWDTCGQSWTGDGRG